MRGFARYDSIDVRIAASADCHASPVSVPQKRKDKWDKILANKLKGLGMNTQSKRRAFELKQKAQAFQIQEALKKEKQTLMDKQGADYEALVCIQSCAESFALSVAVASAALDE